MKKLSSVTLVLFGLVALCNLSGSAMDSAFLRAIGQNCAKLRLAPEVYKVVRELGILEHAPTVRGCRSGRLHRLWHDRFSPSGTILPPPVMGDSSTPHYRQLPCLPRPTKKAHRGRHLKPRWKGGIQQSTAANHNDRQTSSLKVQPPPLRIGLFNARSVSSKQMAFKRTEIVQFVLDNDLDFMVITETWLKEKGDEGSCADLTPAGYTMRSFPRPSRGGGIAVIHKTALSSLLSFTTALPFDHPSFEYVHMTLSLQQKQVQCLCIYRPPPSINNKLTDSTFHSDFHDLLEHVNTLSGTPVLLGDINVHYDEPQHPSTIKMLDFLDTLNFSQLVEKPTHEKNHVLDWVMHRPDTPIVQSIAVTQALVSDHYTVLLQLHAGRPTPAPMFTSGRCLRCMDVAAFKRDLQDSVAQSPTAHQLDAKLRTTLDAHAPIVRRRLRPEKSAPWYSEICQQLRVAKRERRRAEWAWLRSGLTVHKQIFQAAKRAVTTLVHNAKLTFLRDQISNCKSSRKLFDICGRLMGRCTVSPLPTIFPLKQLPEVFSNFFIKKVKDIRDELDSMTVSSAVARDEPVSLGQSFVAFQPVCEEEVKKTVLMSKPTTCPLDPMPTPLLVECLDMLLPSITHILNHSLTSGVFPSLFKTAIVKPLLKKPSLDSNTLKSYRPVSNLSFLSKVLEKLALKQLLSYLTHHDLIPHTQSAYRPSHSTETALLKIMNDILYALDGGDVSFLTLLDLSAAFDTIDHITLLQRLQNLYGISGSALAWFESYLIGRTQTVLVDGQLSAPATLSYGVPQGSVLGPILFILYTKPLLSLIQSHSISTQSYADDTQLQKSCPPSEVTTTVQGIQTCAFYIKSWMIENKLCLKDDKAEALLIKKKSTILSDGEPHSIQIGNSDVPFSTSAGNLGFIMTSDTSLDTHISNTRKSADFELPKISSIRSCLSQQTTIILVCFFDLSKLDYCNSLLTGCSQDLYKLQKVQNAAARLACPLLRSLHWLPISAHIEYKLSTLCFNFFFGTSPAYFSDMLIPYTEVPTPQSDHLCTGGMKNVYFV